MLGLTGGGGRDILVHIGLEGDAAFMRKLQGVDAQVQKTAALQSAALNAAVLAGAAAFTGAVIAATKFESKMADVHTLLGKESKEFDSLNASILELSTRMPKSADELAGALYQVVSATVPASEAMNVLEVSTKAAVGGVADVSSTFTLFSSIIKGYGYEWSEIDKISDIVFQTIKLGQTTMAELAATMGGAVPIASTLGISLEELAGAAATLAGPTGNTAEAMTQLEGIMVMLAKEPTANLATAFEALGVSSGRELVEKFRSLSGAMNALKNYTEDYGLEIGSLLGRKEAMVGFLALTGAQAEDFASKTMAMYNATGLANEAFEIQQATMKAQVELMKNQLNVAFIELGSKILPTLTDALTWINTHPETFMAITKSVTTLIMAVGGLAGAYKAIIAMKALWAASFGPVGIAITAIVVALGALNAAAEAHTQEQLKRIRNTNEESLELLKLKDRYGELAGKTTLTTKEQEEFDKITKIITGKLKEQGIEVINLKDNYEDYITTSIRLRQIGLREELERVNEKIVGLASGTNILGFVLQGLSFQLNSMGDAAQTVRDNALTALLEKQKALTEEIEESTKVFGKNTIAAMTNSGELNEAEKAALKAEAAVRKLKEEQERLAEIHQTLADAGVQTNRSIQEQIDKFEGLYRVAKSINEDRAIAQIMDELNRLYLQIGTDTSLQKYIENMGGAKDVTTEMRVSTFDFLGTLIETVPEVEKYVMENAHLIESQKESTTFTKENAIAMAQLADQVLGAEGALGKMVSVLFTFVANPVLGAVQFLTFALGDMFGTTDKGIKTVDDFIDSLGETGAAIRAVDLEIKNLEGGIKTLSEVLQDNRDIWVDLGFQVETSGVFRYGAEMAANLLAQSEGFTSLSDAIEITQEKLDAFVASIGFDTLFKDAAKFTETLIDETVRLLDYYGSTEWDKSPFLQMLHEQYLVNKDILSGLDPMSQAYADLNAQQVILGYTMAGLVGAQEQYIAGLDETARQILINAGLLIDYAAIQEEQRRIQQEVYETARDAQEQWYKNREELKAFAEAEALAAREAEILAGAQAEAAAEAEVLARAQSEAEEQARAFTEAQAEAERVARLAAEQFRRNADAVAMYDHALLALDWDSQVDVANQLIDLGIKSESSIRAQIMSLEALMGALDPLSYEYEQVRDKVDKLYGELGETSPYQTQIAVQREAEQAAKEYEERIKSLTDEAFLLNGVIGELQDQKINIDTEAMTRAVELMGQMDQLRDLQAYLSQTEFQVDFNYVANALSEITGKAKELTIEWGEMLKAIFQDYTQFEQDMKTAQAAIEQLLYFKIDLDVTDADEQINAAIVRMQDYLKELNPESQAYKDAKKSLDDLITLYGELGLEVDREKAIEFETQNAQNQINALGVQVEGLFQTASEDKIAIDADIAAAQARVMQIENEIEQISPNVTVKANASSLIAAKTSAENLELAINDVPDNKLINLDYNAFEKAYEAMQNMKTILNDIAKTRNISIGLTSVDTAMSRVGSLSGQLSAIPIKNLSINIDSVFTALDYVAILANNIKNLPNKTVTVTVNYVQSGSYHEGGIVQAFHEGGAVLDSANMIVAHEGLGYYKGRKEVPAKLLEGEQVIQPDVAGMFSPAQWDSFRETGDPGALGGDQGNTPAIIINEPGPLTSVSFTDNHVTPRQKEQKAYSVKTLDQFRRFR